jgi:hypothetical protein
LLPSATTVIRPIFGSRRGSGGLTRSRKAGTMKKLLLEDLNVESFSTTSPEGRRGTVVAHETYDAACGYSEYSDCLSCGTDCRDTERADCTGGGGGGTSEGTLCVTRVGDCSQDSCTGPYGCPCTTTMSYDYTFCQTMCC